MSAQKIHQHRGTNQRTLFRRALGLGGLSGPGGLSILALGGAVLALIPAWQPEASAQDALGRGDALDANISPQFGPRNAPARQTDFRARNRIVTGDVAGGRGFRGAVGYGAEGDFRGEIGADDLFDFRAGAAFSGPDFVRRRGGLRDSFQIGQEFGAIEFDRAYSGLPARGHGPAPDRDRFVGDRFVPRDDIQTDIDRMTSALSAARMFEQQSQPRAVGQMRDQEGRPFYMTASSLRGLRPATVEEMQITEMMSTYDYMRLRQDVQQERVQQEIGSPFAPSFLRTLSDPETRTPRDPREERRDDRVTAELESDYTRVLQRIADRYADSPNVQVSVDSSLLGALDDEFTELRESLQRMRDRRGEVLRDDRPESALEDDVDEDSLLPGARPSRDRDATRRGMPDDFEQQPADRDAPRPADEELEPGMAEGFSMILPALRHGERIGRLAPEGESRFAELFQSAEAHLESGQYFLAEQDFNRALRLMPSHPLAQAGAGHAQLGANLYRSAALTLQRLLLNHPEMIDVRYESNLMPWDERIAEMIDELTVRLDSERDRVPASFLLAYLGHQQDDREMVETNLDRLEELRADDPLVALLRAVWLEDDRAMDGLADEIREDLEEAMETEETPAAPSAEK